MDRAVGASPAPIPAIDPPHADFQRLADAIERLSSARSAEQVIEIVRRSARGLSGARGVAVVTRDGDYCHYLAEDSDSPLWAGEKFPAIHCVSGWAMMNGQTAVIPDIYQDARVPHDAYRPTYVKSLVMTPVGEGEAFAAIGAYWDEVRTPAPDEIAVLAALARSTATAIKNIQLYDSLEREAARYDELYRQAQQQLAERDSSASRIRFQAGLLDAVEQAVIATDLDGKVIYWSRFSETLYGWTAEEALGCNILELNTPPGPEAETEVQAILAELQAGRSWSGELWLRRRDGGLFAAQITNSPIHDEHGEFIGIVGVSADVTERHSSERRLRLMVNELNHRVKNTLFTVQAVAAQTFRGAGTIGEAQTALFGRIQALARTHDVLTEERWDGADLREIVDKASMAYGGDDGRRFQIEGPPVRITPQAAVSISLALHELATNAVKHGALSNDLGTISVAWALTPGKRGPTELTLDWIERGGPLVGQPSREGFGMRLLRRGLPADLTGQVDIRYPTEGLTCRIVAPVDPRPSSGQDKPQ
jgi:PAS domain S-box-containing protein